MSEKSPPPSWYEPPEECVDCAECGRLIDVYQAPVCQQCVDEIRAEHEYEVMIDSQFDER